MSASCSAPGVLGYFLRFFGYPVLPAVLGVVLGGLIESNYRRSLVLSGGDNSIFLRGSDRGRYFWCWPRSSSLARSPRNGAAREPQRKAESRVTRFRSRSQISRPAFVRRRCRGGVRNTVRNLLIDVAGLCLAARHTDYVKACVASAVPTGDATAIGHRGVVRAL